MTRETDSLKGISALFYYLSQVFIRVPDREIVELTRRFLPVLDEINQQLSSTLLQKAVAELENFVAEAEKLGSEALSHKLNTDYTYLFLMGRDCVPRSESVWLSPSGLEMQEPREEVVVWFEKYTFIPPEVYKEPEDQLGMEMLFLASLAASAGEAPQDENVGRIYENAISKFIEEHPAKWISHFAQGIKTRQSALKEGCLLSLYYGAALLAEFILTEMYGSR